MTEKQIKTFKILKIVFTVLCIFFIVGLFLQIACMLWLTLMPDKLSAFFERVQIWRPFISNMYPFKRATAELCVSMLSYSFAIFFTKNARDIFSTLSKKEELPVNLIKKEALVLLACFIVLPLVHTIAFSIFVGGNFVRFTPNLSLLAVGILLLGLSGSLIKNKE